VDQGLILETTFLIDLEREVRRGTPGAAVAFLERKAAAALHIAFVTAGELAAGSNLRHRDSWQKFLLPFPVLPASNDVCWHYGELYRDLQARGQLIGGNDLWIAATAVAHEMALVTRNHAHFSRVQGLEILGYG
jgi:tRNA(fMet)-specific endonuclease VapC